MSSLPEVFVTQLEVELFSIEVSIYPQKSWKVIRTFAQFQTLIQELKNCGFVAKDSIQSDGFALQKILRSVVESFGEKVWFIEPLLSFLENVPRKSVLAELQISKLAQQVQYLTRRSTELEANQQELHLNYMELVEKMKGVPVVSSEVSQNDVTVSVKLQRDSEVDVPKQMHNDPSRMSLISVITTDSATDTTVTQAVAGQVDPSYLSEGEEAFVGQRSPLLSVDYSPTPNRGSLKPIPEGEEGIFNELPPSLPNSPYIPVELLPLGEVGSALDIATDSVLKVIAPTEEFIQHRNSIVAMLRRQLRLALGSTAFEIGFPVTRCLLPDDPIRLTVVISKTLVPTWHTLVCEQLSIFAEKVSMYGGSGSVPFEEDEVLDPYFVDCNSYGHHHLGAINHSKQNLNHTVHLVVDNIPIEISANSRTELCMLSLFEETAQLVGRDNLFKRAYLLLRAWWSYETQTFVGCSIRHYLTDSHLFVMLLAIFNRYNDHIQTPFHAFGLFLAEYSTYDGSTQAISIQGLVGFQTRTSNQPQVVDAKPYHVMKGSIIEKHWMSYNIGYANSEPESVTIQKKRSTSSEDPAPVGSPGKTPRDNDSKHLVVENQTEIIKSLSANNIFYFERSAFNIINPLNHTNMVVEKLSQRRISKLYKAFQIGATNFAFYLKRATEPGVDVVETFRSYFPTILTHGNMWNKNINELNVSLTLTSTYELHKIETDVSYCNLMIESIVSDQALQVLAMEILAQKGPLPVGEIGKILAELTSIPSLSLRLKEKFGGLKKFLEQYPESFVVSNDHPFNPNVLLRCSLSPEHLELIDKGIFPHQLLIKAKKAAAATAKKKKSHSIPNGNQFPNLSENNNFRSDHGGPAQLQQQSYNNNAYRPNNMLNMNKGNGIVKQQPNLNSRTKSIPAGGGKTMYGNYQPAEPQYGYHGYIDDHPSMNQPLASHSLPRARSYNNPGDFPTSSNQNPLLSGNHSHSSNNLAYANHGNSAYFDDVLGNTAVSEQNAFSKQFLSHLRTDHQSPELRSDSRGYMENFSVPSSSGKSLNHQPYLSGNGFESNLLTNQKVGSFVGGSGADHAKSQSYSVMGNLFPLVLSQEQDLGPTMNFTSGSLDDYSSLPSNMF